MARCRLVLRADPVVPREAVIVGGRLTSRGDSGRDGARLVFVGPGRAPTRRGVARPGSTRTPYRSGASSTLAAQSDTVESRLRTNPPARTADPAGDDRRRR